MANGTSRVLHGSISLQPGEWKTIAPDSPLEVERDGQKIRLELPGINDWEKPHGALRKADGSSFSVEIELVDGDGKHYKLVPTSLGAWIGFGQDVPEHGAGFKPGRKFHQVRIRSSIPITAKQVDWYCWSGK